MGDRIAISVKNVSKDFRLPHLRANSVKELFVSPFQALQGSKKTEVQHALKDISFDIKEGEFFGIVGRNGSGKSTLLKILAEIYQPTSGEVSVLGRLVPFIELGVGFNPELTGRENVYLSGALNGFSTKEIDAMYDDIVAFAELEQFMDQKLKNYSSGMQVRLAFSVATRSKADVLLIDEVLAVGDADFQRKCFNYFKQLKKDKKTVVFVSHDMEAIREYCDRAVLINESRLLHEGSSARIATEYAKLFMNKNHLSKYNSGNRWGDRKSSAKDVAVEVNNKTIDISLTVFNNSSLEGVTVGFRIRTATGMYITGTNSKLEHMPILFDASNKALVKFSMPNILSDGSFLLDIAIQGQDSITVHDWWDEAETFSVKKERKLSYSIDPGFKSSVDYL